MRKDRNGKDIADEKGIKKRWQENTKLHKESLNDPDDHNDVFTHLQPDILECEVKWALGRNTMKKASGGDGIPAELFKILKDDSVKVLHSIWHKFGKLSSGYRTGKGQFSFQPQRKGLPKSVQTTVHLYSFHMLAR